MKKLFFVTTIMVSIFLVCGLGFASTYSPSQSDLDTFYQVASGTLTGPDSDGTVGNDGTFQVNFSLNEGWEDVQIGRDATIEGTGSAFYDGSWSDLSDYDTYALTFTNTADTTFKANIYFNTGYTDTPWGHDSYYYENGWIEVAPNETVTLSIVLDENLTAYGTTHTLDREELRYISNLGFKIGSDTNGDFEGEVSTVPIPGAVWLLGSGLVGLLGLRRKKKA